MNSSDGATESGAGTGSGNDFPGLINKERYWSHHSQRLFHSVLNLIWLAVSLALIFILVACSSEEPNGTPPRKEPSQVIEDPTAEPDAASRVAAPQGRHSTIDGVFAPGEWDEALEIDLPNGQLLLMHAGSYLYLGIRSEKLGLGSICIIRDEQIAVLHSSAALGTATYEKAGDSWRKSRDFIWTNRAISNDQQALDERQQHLEREKWLASNGLMGNYDEMEYQIAMPDDQIRLAVTYLLSPEYTSTDFWPATVAAGCRDFEPLQSDAPETVEFAPESWMTVIASQE
jgi:hypothetical protein